MQIADAALQPRLLSERAWGTRELSCLQESNPEFIVRLSKIY